jgi:peptide/nickel transport system ATP-binding protein
MTERAVRSRTDDGRHDEEPLLKIRDFRKYYDQAEGVLNQILGYSGKVKAVDGVDLDVYEGEILAVVGESGCGKSTLGKAILNLTKPTGGSVQFKGDDIAGLPEKRMRKYRRDMQMIFQDPEDSLNPRKTVGDILTTPLKVHRIGDDREEREEMSKRILDQVGLKPSHFNRYPRQFSGGQQQRIGLARALVVQPDLIIADEPVSKLDVSVQAQILNRLSELRSEYNLTMIFIAHDLSVVRHIADRVAVMYLGKIVEVAPTDELFGNPRHPYTQSLLSAVPRLDPTTEQDRIVLEGTVPSPLDPPTGCRFHTRCPVIIPPDWWDYDQTLFKSIFNYRVLLEEEEFDLKAIRTRLSNGEGVDDSVLQDYLLDTGLSVPTNQLPEDVHEPVMEATRLYVDDKIEQAVSVLEEAFPSPCVDKEPTQATIDTDHDHRAACHRLDGNFSADMTVIEEMDTIYESDPIEHS